MFPYSIGGEKAGPDGNFLDKKVLITWEPPDEFNPPKKYFCQRGIDYPLEGRKL